jgi:ATP-dependent protease HslVU (ClpYQ) peptidase subunit
MTTCTWDGKRLSADTRSITGSTIDQAACQKIFQRKGIYCALAGDIAEAIIVIDYLLGKEVEPPELPVGDFQIILVSKTRCEYYYNSLNPSPLESPSAIGSGADYALSAMLCGKSGSKAVTIAAKLDPYTSVDYGVRSFKIR